MLVSLIFSRHGYSNSKLNIYSRGGNRSRGKSITGNPKPLLIEDGREESPVQIIRLPAGVTKKPGPGSAERSARAREPDVNEDAPGRSHLFPPRHPGSKDLASGSGVTVKAFALRKHKGVPVPISIPLYFVFHLAPPQPVRQRRCKMKEKDEVRKLTNGIELGENRKGENDMKRKTGWRLCGRCDKVWCPVLAKSGRMPRGSTTCPHCGAKWTGFALKK